MPNRDTTSYTQQDGSTTQNQGNLDAPNESPVYTKKSIGYADGYSQFTQRTGGHAPDGTETTEKIIQSDAVEHAKSASPELLIDVHSNKFRRTNEFINGYGGAGWNKGSDAYEDPTYLIFDLSLMKTDSPLFREDLIKSFITEYSDSVPELAERDGYWEAFTGLLFKIFPSDLSGDGSGSKRHYIESIGGLDVLLNPIINYPEDKITFQITEDIAMSLQYLSELYNNLTYSYDSQRYLIPDNLLRFNMRITIRDMRNMKIPTTYNDVITDTVNADISTFIYILHDCQFNFMKTKNFGTDIRRSGFGAPASTISAGGTIEMNFKSYSKITAPQLIDNSLIVDFRERETQSLSKAMKDKIYKIEFNGDYKSPDEVLTTEKNNEQIKNVTYRSVGDIITSSNQDKRPGAFQFPEINTSFRGFANLVNREIIEVRNVIIKQIYTEVNQLITTGERIIGNKLGFTLGKTNVYYYSLEEKAVTRFAFMFEDLLRGEAKILNKNLGKVWNQPIQEMENSAENILAQYYNPNYTFVKPLTQTNVYSTPTNTTSDINKQFDINGITGYTIKPVNWNVNGGTEHTINKIDWNVTGGTTHTIDKVDWNVTSGTAHIIKPVDWDVNGGTGHTINKINWDVNGGIGHTIEKLDWKIEDKGTYNEKYPSGVVESGGTYNKKYPDGTVEPEGTYNQKYPNGVVEPKGGYNQKYPEGIVEGQGTYNEKYPKGVVEAQGTYNEKYPKGTVEAQGQYNEKYPKGSVEPEGTYNEKYPAGAVESEGTYNEKYPSGSVESGGTYNQKYPKGTVEAQGTYNEKYPSGSVESGGTYNEKYPKGSVEPEGIYNEKYPKGSVELEGQYNEKYPEGSVEGEGSYNQKFPEGVVESEGTYNEKYPDGVVEPEGTPHNKQPNGSVEKKGTYNEKLPSGNVYGKNKPLPPATLKLGNVNKNKRQ